MRKTSQRNDILEAYSKKQEIMKLQGLYFGKTVGYHKMISNRIKLQPQLYIPEVQVYTYLQICVGRINFF